MDYLKLTVDKLSVEAISDLVMDDSCGAVTIFAGTTRDHFEGKKVVRLEYEAYESMALKALKEICGEIRENWSAVHSIAIYHRLGTVPCREASVVIAISSPHRRDSLDAVAFCIDRLKASVPIWKKEVYDQGDPSWKENQECDPTPRPPQPSDERPTQQDDIDKNLVQINVSNEELQQRIQNFIERKREQVNISNIHDFIAGIGQSGMEDPETCARVRTQFVRRSDSKGHLKIGKVDHEWGPQTVQSTDFQLEPKEPVVQHSGLPSAIAERVLTIEKFLNATPVSKDIYKRLKDMEERIAQLETMSPEYAQFWRSHKGADHTKQNNPMDYAFSAEDIARKIEQLEKQMKT